MASRERNETLKKLKEKYGTVWSHSRLGNFNTCGMQYFLCYIQRMPSENGIYGLCGGHAHDVLEDYYRGNIKYEDMYDVFGDKFLQTTEIDQVKFPLGDNEKNKWYKCVSHFMKTHVPIEYQEIVLEELALFKIGDNVMQGYLDVIYKDMDGKIVIMDWKTSTMFAKAKKLEAGRQLVLYKIAYEALTGVKVDRVCWNMLKYCNIEYASYLKSGKKKIKSKRVMRHEVVKAKLELLRKKLGQELELYMLDFNEEKENWEVFPGYDEMEFNITDCIVDYEVTDELRQETIDYVVNTINNIKVAGNMECNFEAKEEVDFFCNCLCSFKQYCDKYKESQDDSEGY